MDNTISDNITGTTSILAGTYLGYKAITSGVRRGLGIRIEEHTTNLKNAKSIIQCGCILEPGFGGSASGNIFDTYKNNSKNFVHITGYHKDFISAFDPQLQGVIRNNKCTKTILETPLLHPVRTIYRKFQRLMYRFMSTSQIHFDKFMGLELGSDIRTRKDVLKKMFQVLTGRGTKTFFVGGTDNFFNTNFIPDVNEIALKTDKPLKVCRTKIGAIFSALKREGLSGMLQNKYRVGAGITIALFLGYLSSICINSGLKKLYNS